MFGHIVGSLQGDVVSLLDVVWRCAGGHTPKLGTFVFGEGGANGLIVNFYNHALTAIVHVSSEVKESGVFSDRVLEAVSAWCSTL